MPRQRGARLGCVDAEGLIGVAEEGQYLVVQGEPADDRVAEPLEAGGALGDPLAVPPGVELRNFDEELADERRLLSDPSSPCSNLLCAFWWETTSGLRADT